MFRKTSKTCRWFSLDAGENPDARAATVYKPKQTWNYEIGTHLNLFQKNRLRADAAPVLA